MKIGYAYNTSRADKHRQARARGRIVEALKAHEALTFEALLLETRMSPWAVESGLVELEDNGRVEESYCGLYQLVQ